MNLREVVAMLDLLRTDESQWMVPTIYAREPWDPESEALVAWAPMRGGLPDAAARAKMVRLTEVKSAMSLIQDQSYRLRAAGDLDALCSLLIQRVLAQVPPPRARTSREGDA